MTGVDNYVVNVAIPSIRGSFGATVNDVVWVYSAYLLAYAVLLILGGRLGDRFGPKRAFLAGLATFVLASLACALSPSIAALVVSRAIQGVGAALMTPQPIALIVHMFPAARRGSALGVWAAVGGVTIAAGPLLGGLLIATFGWRSIFLINVGVSIWLLSATLMLAGAGLGAMTAPLPSIGTRTLPKDLVGVASGV